MNVSLFFLNLHRNNRLSIFNIIDVDFPRQFYFSRYLMISVLERDRRAGLSCTSDGTNLPEPAKFDFILNAICRRIVTTKFFSCICILCIAITYLSKYVPIQFDRFQLESICENPTFCRTILFTIMVSYRKTSSSQKIQLFDNHSVYQYCANW